MKVSVATPERRIYSGEAENVVVQAEKGELKILELHANLITLVKPGKLKISGSNPTELKVGEGVLKIEDNQMSILCSKVEVV